MDWLGIIGILRRNAPLQSDPQQPAHTPAREFENLTPEQMFLAARYKLPPMEMDWADGIEEAYSAYGLEDRFYYEWYFERKQMSRYTRRT